MRKYSRHYFKLDQLEGSVRERNTYIRHTRRFFNLYKTEVRDGLIDDKPAEYERKVFEGHVETFLKRKPDSFSLRFHIGNLGSETPWDGHIILGWFGFFWGHSAFGKLADWLTRCSGYKYDSRDWSIRISDGRFWWSFAEHSDMCKKFSGWHPSKDGKKKRRNSWLRRGSFRVNPISWIWGPKRYTYEDIGAYASVLTFEEGEYPILVKLQKQYFGRTKVNVKKHIQTWTLDVDAPSGIPTHVDYSGGWKGEETYGFSVPFHEDRFGWQIDADMAIQAWVLQERAKTGWRPTKKEGN